ncbi:MAG: HAMP domain-containing histidine kinase [Verrucomicrobiaceae bacterium]|nr:HAMP domain-containing histidine kinase [Verrucomicrobiaceae bacterium]
MTLRRRILWYYSFTLSLSLVIVGFWSWFEFNEQREEALHGGAEAALKHDPLEETFEIILYGGLPAILLGIFGGGLLMRRALRPIEELTEVLEKTDVSNLGHLVPRSGNGDELDRMTAVFNRMKQRLGASFTQSREFTLHASHELKTPLTILHGTLEQMLTQEPVDGAGHDKLVSMIEEVQRLSHIVGQLAFLARADAGQMALNKEEVTLDELVRDLADETAILAAPRRIEVALKACEPCRVNADRMRLRQLLLNLADNAVKHNREGGSVQIRLVTEGRHAVFGILNTGLLLPPEQHERVFERFFRGEAAHGYETDGSGLGLSIAQSIVAAHGGEIGYSTTGEERTEVTFRLPLAGQER